MSIVGVIAEYNPFHNGHLYHLNKAKEMFKDSYFVLILIGNFNCLPLGLNTFLSLLFIFLKIVRQ